MENNQKGDLTIKLETEKMKLKYLTFMNNYYVVFNKKDSAHLPKEQIEVIINGEEYQYPYEIIVKESRVDHIIMHMNMINYSDYATYQEDLVALRIKTEA